MVRRHSFENAENSAKTLPFVSLVIPCRDERHFIGGCLESLLANDYPLDRLEILLVDAKSRDGTRTIVEKFMEHYPNIRLLDNEQRIIPAALNIGIHAARGEIIMKIDAHCRYAPDHISGCVTALERYGASNTGGVLVTLPRGDTLTARSIAVVLASFFGSGNSYTRIGDMKPRWSDTVAFGCYRRGIFEQIGYFDEDLARSSDMELNVRLRRAGGGILLLPEIKVSYYPSSVTFRSFLLRNIVDGFWALYPLKFGRRAVYVRHVVPGACILAGVLASGLGEFFGAVTSTWSILLGVYLAVSIGVAARIALREGNLAFAVTLPLAFAIRHFAYGAGSVAGLITAVMSPRFWRSLGRPDRRAPAVSSSGSFETK